MADLDTTASTADDIRIQVPKVHFMVMNLYVDDGSTRWNGIRLLFCVNSDWEDNNCPSGSVASILNHQSATMNNPKSGFHQCRSWREHVVQPERPYPAQHDNPWQWSERHLRRVVHRNLLWPDEQLAERTATATLELSTSSVSNMDRTVDQP
jgi:hypothetical protein